MKVYRYTADADSFASLDERAKDRPVLDAIVGQPLAAKWTPLKLKWDDGVERRGDFPSLRDTVPTLSQKAWDLLAPILGTSVEALPATGNDGERLYLLNVLDARKCLDLERSKVEYDDGHILFIDKYRFIEGSLDGAMIFRLAEEPGFEILLTEQFKAKIKELRLVGLLWDRV